LVGECWRLGCRRRCGGGPGGPARGPSRFRAFFGGARCRRPSVASALAALQPVPAAASPACVGGGAAVETVTASVAAQGVGAAGGLEPVRSAARVDLDRTSSHSLRRRGFSGSPWASSSPTSLRRSQLIGPAGRDSIRRVPSGSGTCVGGARTCRHRRRLGASLLSPRAGEWRFSERGAKPDAPARTAETRPARTRPSSSWVVCGKDH
jgi:hypothetical protein